MIKVDGKQTGTYDGIVYILCGEKGKEIYLTANGDENDKFVCLDDCLEIIGYNENKDVTMIVIIENALNGKVYRYNNYSDKCWYEYGETRGFA